MEVDREAPVVAEATIEIAALPDVVWDTVADFERWPVWNPDVKRMSLDGPVAEGTTFRWKAGPGIITSMLRSVQRPTDDGSTVVRTVESWAGWLPRLLRGPLRKQLQKGLDAGLPHLKGEAERRAAAR